MKLIDVFPYGTGFVLVFEYMLSDLSEVLRNSARPLTEVSLHFLVNISSKHLHQHNLISNCIQDTLTTVTPTNK